MVKNSLEAFLWTSQVFCPRSFDALGKVNPSLDFGLAALGPREVKCKQPQRVRHGETSPKAFTREISSSAFAVPALCGSQRIMSNLPKANFKEFMVWEKKLTNRCGEKNSRSYSREFLNWQVDLLDMREREAEWHFFDIK